MKDHLKSAFRDDAQLAEVCGKPRPRVIAAGGAARGAPVGGRACGQGLERTLEGIRWQGSGAALRSSGDATDRGRCPRAGGHRLATA